MDFESVFDALRAVGYDDWLTSECRLRGGEPEEALPASTRFLAGFLWRWSSVPYLRFVYGSP